MNLLVIALPPLVLILFPSPIWFAPPVPAPLNNVPPRFRHISNPVLLQTPTFAFLSPRSINPGLSRSPRIFPSPRPQTRKSTARVVSLSCSFLREPFAQSGREDSGIVVFCLDHRRLTAPRWVCPFFSRSPPRFHWLIDSATFVRCLMDRQPVTLLFLKLFATGGPNYSACRSSGSSPFLPDSKASCFPPYPFYPSHGLLFLPRFPKLTGNSAGFAASNDPPF